jgi:hypothetical protein
MTDDAIGGLRLVNSGDLYRQPHTPRQKYQVAMVACYGKQAFATPQEAHKAILGFSRRKKGPRAKRGGRMEPYKCSGCGMYHLATKQKK